LVLFRAIRIVLGLVADRRLIKRLFTSYAITALVHSSRLHKPDIGRLPLSEYFSVNVRGTQNLIETAIRAEVDRPFSRRRRFRR
jgi:UDP-glucose 4-epimerase